MKLNKKHIHALDIGIHKVLGARDRSNNPDEKDMLTLNANRLRQLRMLLWVAFTEPKFDFNVLFKLGISEQDPMAKGIRMLTNDPLINQTPLEADESNIDRLDRKLTAEQKVKDEANELRKIAGH